MPPPDRRRSGRASIAHTWLRIFFWFFPGLTVIPLLMLGWFLADRYPSLELIVAVAALSTFALILLVCALLDALRHLTRIHGTGQFGTCLRLKFALLFLAVQVVVTPALTLTATIFVWILSGALIP